MSPSWDAFAVEYERRVEPFTSQYAAEILSALAGERDGSLRRPPPRQERGAPRPRLLDVGCGTGAASLRAQARGFDVAWTDVSTAMVARTTQRVLERAPPTAARDYVGASCRVADGGSLPAEWADAFDVAVANFSVIFFPDPTAGLKEMRRCLVPSTGVAAVSAWGAASETPAFRIFLAVAAEVAPDLVATGKPRRISGSVAALTTLMEGAGFVDVIVEGPMVKTLVVASPAAYYDRFALTSPPNADMIARMDDATRIKFRSRVMEMAKARGGQEDGTVALDSAAYIVYGRRPDS